MVYLIMLAEFSSVLVCEKVICMFDTSRMPIIGSNAISRCLSYRASYLTQVVVFNANCAFELVFYPMVADICLLVLCVHVYFLGYRESAAFLQRAADQLEDMLHKNTAS